MKMDPILRVGRAAQSWTRRVNPWTNVYGTARTMIALGTLSTLVFSRPDSIFRPVVGVSRVPVCIGVDRIGMFCRAPNHLDAMRWVAVAILLLVISGWRPRVTGPLHWFVSFSLATSGVLVDGGDQVAQVLTTLLLPVTLTDSRTSHWQAPSRQQGYYARLTALTALLAIRLQVAGIYFHAAIGKFRVPEWTDGTVLYYWFSHPVFGASPFMWRILEPLLRQGTTLALMTWGSMALEMFLFMALVMPKKAWPYLLGTGIAFHLGIAIIQGLGSFSLAMIGALILYLRPAQPALKMPGLYGIRREHGVPVPSQEGANA